MKLYTDRTTFEELIKDAASGDQYAIYYLGTCYYRGEIAPKCWNEAHRWLCKVKKTELYYGTARKLIRRIELYRLIIKIIFVVCLLGVVLYDVLKEFYYQTFEAARGIDIFSIFIVTGIICFFKLASIQGR